METVKRPAIGERLRRERERLGWTQEQLAAKINTSAVSINRWEKNKTLPRTYYREQLCNVFNKSLAELFDRDADAEEDDCKLPPLWNVPHLRNLYFTDREHILHYLHDTLTLRGNAPLSSACALTCAISGLGGVGKTQTALEYAYRYGSEYKAVFWAKASSHKSLISDFVALAQPLNLLEKEEADQDHVVAAVKRWLQANSQWLLILDNADDLEMVYDFLPALGDGRTLLTTRSQATGPNIKGIELVKMEAQAGVLLLLRRAKIIAEDASLDQAPDEARREAEAICALVDGLPLALDQAAAYVEENRCSLGAYRELFQTRRAQLLKRRGTFSKRDYPDTVATTWSLSFERVEVADPVAANLLRLCAFLHADFIPEEMILAGASELGSAWLPIVDDPLRLDDAIGELRKYSLIRRHPETKTLTMHQLVQMVLKDAMGEERQREWARCVVSLVNRAFPANEKVEMWPQCERYLPHARVCAELIEQWDMAFPAAAHLLNRIGTYLYERGHYTEAESLLQRALSIRERVHTADSADVAESLNDLGIVYRARGKYSEAEDYLRRALTIRQEKYGPLHIAVAESLTGLAWVYQSQGNYEQAEPFLQRALAISEQHFGPVHHDVAESLNELAGCYHYQGKFEQAERLYQRTLSILEQAEGANHLDLARCFNNLAVVNRELGRYEQAEPLFQQALSVLEQILGPQHPDVATILNALARLYSVQQQYERAEATFKRALAIREQMLGTDHPKVATCLNDLARLYAGQGRYVEAEPFYQRSLAIQEQRLGQEHPDLVDTLRNYARLLRLLGRKTEASAFEARAHVITLTSS
jgi:tetratricopeptide (TPR) repeat protein